MNRSLLLAFLAGCTLAGPALPQSDPALADTRARLAGQLKAGARAKLPLGKNEAQVFWPLYDEYRADAAWVGDRAAELFEDFVAAYPTMDDEQAGNLLRQWLELQHQQLDVKQRWVERFLEKVPARTVARFFQIENQYEAAVRAELAKGIPLIKVELPNDYLDPLRNPLDAN
jgi:hypothetical protein